MPLGKELPHGRYIAEAFTFKKPPYVTFEPSMDYLDYEYHYLFATPDADTVFVVCNDEGVPGSQNATVVPVGCKVHMDMNLKDANRNPVDYENEPDWSYSNPEMVEVKPDPWGPLLIVKRAGDFWVEVTVDGGASWHAATGTANWSYTAPISSWRALGWNVMFSCVPATVVKFLKVSAILAKLFWVKTWL